MIAELNDEHIDMLLKTEVVGHLACSVGDRPYVVPISYVYEDGCIYSHTTEGRKIDMMRRNPHVCVEVEHVRNPLNWQSVIAFGKFEELTGAEAANAMGRFVRRLSTYLDGQLLNKENRSAVDVVSRQIHVGPGKAVFYRIRLTEKHGRYEQV